jgi:hypothetical protein
MTVPYPPHVIALLVIAVLSHVMAGLVPAISIRKNAALHMIGITGTRPVMTRVCGTGMTNCPMNPRPLTPRTSRA